MKYSDWLLSLNMFLSSVFHNNISTLEINMCIVYLYQASMGKSSKKIGKTQLSQFLKSYLTSCQCIGGHKKKEKNNKSKTTTLTFLHNLKKKQQYQGSEKWCYAESFTLLTI